MFFLNLMEQYLDYKVCLGNAFDFLSLKYCWVHIHRLLMIVHFFLQLDRIFISFLLLKNVLGISFNNYYLIINYYCCNEVRLT